jgi:hypothetical protein
MAKARISILGAMGYVLIASLILILVRVELGMVHSAPEGWANLAQYLAATMLVIATYRARYRKGIEADWWFGFALGGWAYYLVSGNMTWEWPSPTHRPRSLVASLQYRLVNLVFGHWIHNIIMANSFVEISAFYIYLTRAAQAVSVLFAGVAGGLVNSVLSWRRSTHDRN